MTRGRLRLALVLWLAAAVACGSDPSGAPGASGGEAARPVVVASQAFPENVIVATMYARALEAAGRPTVLYAAYGRREIYVPALEKGGRGKGVDLVPEYAASMLEFVNHNAGEASGDLDVTMARLRERLRATGLVALRPSPATNQNAFAVTRATAQRLNLRTISDLAPVAPDMTLGAGPECPTRPFCLAGLERVYGLRFGAFRALDAGGPRTKSALASGEIDVGLVFSSDGAVPALGLVVLEDDKRLQAADNLVPVIRADVLDAEIRRVLDRISAALTTEDLIELNRRAEIDGEDPERLAEEWLRSRHLLDR